jgi:D-arabinose 1-dehydrogenase-like Zn-dependent alcohol dehydrogenase
MNEIFPLEEAQAAYDRMKSGKARFRVVLKMDS